MTPALHPSQSDRGSLQAVPGCHGLIDDAWDEAARFASRGRQAPAAERSRAGTVTVRAGGPAKGGASGSASGGASAPDAAD